MKSGKFQSGRQSSYAKKRDGERGAALAASLIILTILGAISVSVLAVVSTEANVAGSDLQRTQTFYASSAGIEKMTNDFSNLFTRKLRPTPADLNQIKNSHPTELLTEGFTFTQELTQDDERLAAMRLTQGIGNDVYPRVNIAEGSYAGLFASIVPYRMSSTATQTRTGAQVRLDREMNNFLIPLFQFGIFSNEDIEIHPGPLMTYNGRVHANGNIYALRNTIFLNKVTTAGEFVFDAWRSGITNNGYLGSDNVWMRVNGIDVQITKGSVERDGSTVGGPNFLSATSGQRGFYPGSPNGVANPNWEATSILPAVTGVPNQFGGQLLTRTTGALPLRLPLQLDGNSPQELIKRAMPADSAILSESRYHSKAQIRILIDDEGAGSGAANVGGIPAGKGVNLSAFNPSSLGGGNALRRVSDAGAYLDSAVRQDDPNTALVNPIAETVRGIRNYVVSDVASANDAHGVPKSPNGAIIPPGAGITGRILIEIVAPNGTVRDVTQQILSMGMTEGEPNGIVYLQRPLWAAFMQGSRDRGGVGFFNDLTYLTTQTGCISDGEVNDANVSFDATYGHLNTPAVTLDDDPFTVVFTPTQAKRDRRPNGAYNQIVPINVYNVREGWFRSPLDEFNVYERGITSVVEINMKNLARWVDGVYDSNLLSGTNAVSTNIEGVEGYILYISDRRGDRVKQERDRTGATINTTNGTVDNEDIYGPNGTLDPGEDVINAGWDIALNLSKAGSLQKDTTNPELPDLGTTWDNSDRLGRARTISSWMNTNNYFRRAVRLFNGETLATTQGANKLSSTKGLTVATENMVYLWGNYNTTGVSTIPALGSTLNEGDYLGTQVPASIVADAFFPISKTWFDAVSALYPEGADTPRDSSSIGTRRRRADAFLPSVDQGTAVRAGIIAGTTISALNGTPSRDPDSARGRLSGGIINYPRFLEVWGNDRAWSFAGSFVPMFRSTQAISQWENETAVIYMPPRRNWAFDITFRNPNRLPPGTPFFQYIEATGFRQKITD